MIFDIDCFIQLAEWFSLKLSDGGKRKIKNAANLWDKAFENR